MAAFSLDDINRSFAQTIPSAYGLGVRFTEARRGFVSAAVPFEGNGNHFGVMYAGVIFTVAEVLGGAMAWSTFDASRYYALVKSLTIDFLAPGRSDLTASTRLDEVTIAEVEQAAAVNGKAAFELVAAVYGADDTLVARTRGDYQIRALSP